MKHIKKLFSKSAIGGFLFAFAILAITLVGIGYAVYKLWMWPLLIIIATLVVVGGWIPLQALVSALVKARAIELRQQWNRLNGEFDIEDQMYFDKDFLYKENANKVHPTVRRAHSWKNRYDDYKEKKKLSALTKELKKHDQHQQN